MSIKMHLYPKKTIHLIFVCLGKFNKKFKIAIVYFSPCKFLKINFNSTLIFLDQALNCIYEVRNLITESFFCTTCPQTNLIKRFFQFVKLQLTFLMVCKSLLSSSLCIALLNGFTSLFCSLMTQVTQNFTAGINKKQYYIYYKLKVLRQIHRVYRRAEVSRH